MSNARGVTYVYPPALIATNIVLVILTATTLILTAIVLDREVNNSKKIEGIDQQLTVVEWIEILKIRGQSAQLRSPGNLTDSTPCSLSTIIDFGNKNFGASCLQCERGPTDARSWTLDPNSDKTLARLCGPAAAA